MSVSGITWRQVLTHLNDTGQWGLEPVELELQCKALQSNWATPADINDDTFMFFSFIGLNQKVVAGLQRFGNVRGFQIAISTMLTNHSLNGSPGGANPSSGMLGPSPPSQGPQGAVGSSSSLSASASASASAQAAFARDSDDFDAVFDSGLAHFPGSGQTPGAATTTVAALFLSCCLCQAPAEPFNDARGSAAQWCQDEFCSSCLSRLVRDCISEKRVVGGITCRCCGKTVEQRHLRRVISPELFDQLLEAEVAAFTDNVVECPQCHTAMSVEPRPVPSVVTEKDEQGRPLSRVAFAHFIEHRFRCVACSTNFCSECKLTPYHKGFTCAEHRAYLSAPHCRFCDKRMSAETETFADVCQRAADGIARAHRDLQGKLTPATTLNQPQMLRVSEVESLLPAATGTQPLPLFPVPDVLKNVCGDADCVMRAQFACRLTLPCGCPCPGVIGENVCPPCLVHGPGGDTSEDFCNLCFSEPLRAAPVVKSGSGGARGYKLPALLKGFPESAVCGHTFHYHCALARLRSGPGTAEAAAAAAGSSAGDAAPPATRLSFEHRNCSECRLPIFHQRLLLPLHEIMSLEQRIQVLALNRLVYESMDKDEALVDSAGKWFGKPLEYALHSFVFQQCFKCQQPYFAGGYMCDDAANDGVKREDLLCPACQPSSQGECKTHSKEYLLYKCRYCCQPSNWSCWGNTHFCNDCHKSGVWQNLSNHRTGINKQRIWEYPQCSALMSKITKLRSEPSFISATDDEQNAMMAKLEADPHQCPLKRPHPPNGFEYALGCVMCDSSIAPGSCGGAGGAVSSPAGGSPPAATAATAAAAAAAGKSGGKGGEKCSPAESGSAGGVRSGPAAVATKAAGDKEASPYRALALAAIDTPQVGMLPQAKTVGLWSYVELLQALEQLASTGTEVSDPTPLSAGAAHCVVKRFTAPHIPPDVVICRTSSVAGAPNAPAPAKGSCYNAWVIKFRHTHDFDRNGLFYFLGTCGYTQPWVNPALRGLVSAESTERPADSLPPWGALNRTPGRCVTQSKPESWFSFDLHVAQLLVQGFTMRHYTSWDGECVRSWNLEGSQDGVTWQTIVSHKNDASIQGASASKTWILPPVPASQARGNNGLPMRATPASTDTYRHVRVLQTGPNSFNNHFLPLAGFELYGQLVLPALPDLYRQATKAKVLNSPALPCPSALFQLVPPARRPASAAVSAAGSVNGAADTAAAGAAAGGSSGSSGSSLASSVAGSSVAGAHRPVPPVPRPALPAGPPPHVHAHAAGATASSSLATDATAVATPAAAGAGAEEAAADADAEAPAQNLIPVVTLLPPTASGASAFAPGSTGLLGYLGSDAFLNSGAGGAAADRVSTPANPARVGLITLRCSHEVTRADLGAARDRSPLLELTRPAPNASAGASSSLSAPSPSSATRAVAPFVGINEIPLPAPRAADAAAAAAGRVSPLTLAQAHAPWVTVDFGAFRVAPVAYAVRQPVGAPPLQAWRVEACYDDNGLSWIPVDQRANDQALATAARAAAAAAGTGARAYEAIFTVPGARIDANGTEFPIPPVRLLRLRSAAGGPLLLAGLEVFGRLGCLSPASPHDWRRTCVLFPSAAGHPGASGAQAGGGPISAALLAEVPGLRVLEFNWASDFDENGILYYLGTRGLTTPWRNPAGPVVPYERGAPTPRRAASPWAVQAFSSELAVTPAASLTASAICGREVVRCVTRSTSRPAYYGVDFGPHNRVVPTAYSLRHYESHATECVRNWQLLGSLDGSTWTLLAAHRKDASINGKGATATWSIDVPKAEADGLAQEPAPALTPQGLRLSRGFRFLAVQQIGPNSNKNTFFPLSGVEFYGQLISAAVPLSHLPFPCCGTGAAAGPYNVVAMPGGEIQSVRPARATPRSGATVQAGSALPLLEVEEVLFPQAWVWRADREREGVSLVGPAPGDSKIGLFASPAEFPYRENENPFGDVGVVNFIGTGYGRGDPWQNPVLQGRMNVTSSRMSTRDSTPAYGSLSRHPLRCVTASASASQVAACFFAWDMGVWVAPTHYALRHYSTFALEALRSWALSASIDGMHWHLLSEHRNDQTLCHKGQAGVWAIDGAPADGAGKRFAYRFFRLVQLGHNSNEHDYIALSGFELFGTVYAEMPSSASPKHETKQP